MPPAEAYFRRPRRNRRNRLRHKRAASRCRHPSRPRASILRSSISIRRRKTRRLNPMHLRPQLQPPRMLPQLRTRRQPPRWPRADTVGDSAARKGREPSSPHSRKIRSRSPCRRNRPCRTSTRVASASPRHSQKTGLPNLNRRTRFASRHRSPPTRSAPHPMTAVAPSPSSMPSSRRSPHPPLLKAKATTGQWGRQRRR